MNERKNNIMKKTDKNAKLDEIAESYKKTITRVKKLACGKSIKIDSYGTVRAYKSKSGKRMFALSKSSYYYEGGNLSLLTVVNDLADSCCREMNSFAAGKNN